MSDLVGNPEDLFSHNEAHFRFYHKVMWPKDANVDPDQTVLLGEQSHLGLFALICL